MLTSIIDWKDAPLWNKNKYQKLQNCGLSI